MITDRRLRLMAAATMLWLVGSCGFLDQSPSAVDNGIDFATLLQRGDYSRAYKMLCGAQRARVSKQAFVQSEGLAVSPIMGLPSWAWDKPNGKDPEDVDDSVDSIDLQFTTSFQANGAPDSTGVTSTWLVRMARENDDWKLCEFTWLDGDPPGP